MSKAQNFYHTVSDITSARYQIIIPLGKKLHQSSRNAYFQEAVVHTKITRNQLIHTVVKNEEW